MTLAVAPPTSTTSALWQLVATFALVGGSLGAVYIWAAVMHVRAARRANALAAPTTPTVPLDVQPPGAQVGKHRAELIEHDTCPISMADVERAVLAGRVAR